MAILAAVRSYTDIVAAVTARRRALGLTQEELDRIAGFPDRYVGKIEIGVDHDPLQRRLQQVVKRRSKGKRTCGRALGPMSLPVMLQALGLEFCIREALPPDRIEARRSNGRAGGLARARTIPKERRSAIAAAGARARWASMSPTARKAMVEKLNAARRQKQIAPPSRTAAR
jgi:hypothetical protein